MKTGAILTWVSFPERKVFFSHSQLSEGGGARCPLVQPPCASAAIRTLNIPETDSHINDWTHTNTAHIGIAILVFCVYRTQHSLLPVQVCWSVCRVYLVLRKYTPRSTTCPGVLVSVYNVHLVLQKHISRSLNWTGVLVSG